MLTLDECIKIAMDNNIDLKRARNNSLIAKSNRFQALMNFLPNVSGQIDFTQINRSTFDAVSEQLVTNFRTSDPSINANFLIFNGFGNHYNRKATEQALLATESGIEEQKQSVKSAILGSYLSVILDKENIKIAEQRIDLLEAQLSREQKRLSVGVGNLEQVYNFRSQLANEKLRLVNLRNTLKTDKLTLIQSLQLDVTEDIEFAAYELQSDEVLLETEPFKDVYNATVNYSPGLKRAHANAISSKYNFKTTRASMFPTLGAFARYGSRYSSLAAEDIDGQLNAISYIDQVSVHKMQFYGLNLSIPIFNNLINRNNTQVAKINMYNAELDLKQAELNVTNSVQQVYLDLISAQETYKAAQENLVSLNQSYEFVNTRYRNGNTDFYTYLESLNNKNRAEIELINARYSIIFRKKILDVFRGLN